MLAWLLIALVRLYQRTFSLLVGEVCRFEPSCSRYALACLQTHGALRGSLLSIVRVCKCHPFHPGGYDPPPGRSPYPYGATSTPPPPRALQQGTPEVR